MAKQLPFLSSAYVLSALLGSVLIGVALTPRTESEIKMRVHEADPSDVKRKNPKHHRALVLSHNSMIGAIGVILILLFIRGFYQNRIEKSWWLMSLPGASAAADQGLYGYNEYRSIVEKSIRDGSVPDSVTQAVNFNDLVETASGEWFPRKDFEEVF